VTVLFGDLSDFTSWSEDLDPERVGVVTDRVLAPSPRVGEFGGHVDKLTGDGLMAVFGAPTAHEDDAERAVRAAARMQSAVRRVVEEESGGGRRLGLRVGLNTGEVLAGVQAHLSYTVIGDTVNTASRLSDAAGVGAVLAGRSTALATMTAASWRALAPLRLKGKREPVPAYELVSLRPPGATRVGLGDEAPFLGREAELGLLIGRLLESADRLAPHAVLLTGEAGVGKTRLAQELARFAGELPAARVLWGRCAPYGEGRDLAAVAEMVRTACGISENDDVPAARARVERTVARLVHPDTGDPLPRVVAERLGLLLGLDEEIDGGAPRESPTPVAAAGGEKIRSAVGLLFTALAVEGPLLLVVDDLHQATPTMLEGMLDVVRQTRGRVLLVLSGRPDMLGTAHDDAWWRALPEVEVLPLLPLEETSAERLLRAYLGAPDDALDDAVRTALLSRAAGNPFFLAELLHLLIDRGVLRRDGDRWVLDDAMPRGCCRPGCTRCSPPASTGSTARPRACCATRACWAPASPSTPWRRSAAPPGTASRRWCSGRCRRWSSGGCWSPTPTRPPVDPSRRGSPGWPTPPSASATRSCATSPTPGWSRPSGPVATPRRRPSRRRRRPAARPTG
jgi:class 3 adenylate cyclase